MSQHEYIHINEAVKTYEKTRQTFYNYMHKGLVRTKKVNNKVYLNQDDIEQLMNGYIPDAIEPEEIVTTSQAEDHGQEEIIDAVDIASTGGPHTHQTNTADHNIIKDITRLHEQYYQLTNTILHHIDISKQELFLDTKRMHQDSEQRILLSLHQKEKTTESGEKQLQPLLTTTYYNSKKSLFWSAYASFIIVNILISIYIL